MSCVVYLVCIDLFLRFLQLYKCQYMEKGELIIDQDLRLIITEMIIDAQEQSLNNLHVSGDSLT